MAMDRPFQSAAQTEIADRLFLIYSPDVSLYHEVFLCGNFIFMWEIYIILFYVFHPFWVNATWHHGIKSFYPSSLLPFHRGFRIRLCNGKTPS